MTTRRTNQRRATLLAALRRRVADGTRDAEGGIAMLTAVLLVLVLGALSVLMLGVVVSQARPTMFADKNARTVFAAETGLDAALSQMRSALGAPDILTGKIFGDPSKLPCTVQGSVGAAGSTLRYNVTITYYDENPAGKSAAWRASEKMTCSPTTGVLSAPSFALLSSQGSDSALPGFNATAGNRAVETVYTFQVSTNNIDGGVIYAFGDKHCLQATGQTVGSKVIYVPAAECRDEDPRVLWSYASDYKIHLSVTDLGGPAAALCMTGNAQTGGNIEVTLTKCNSASVTQFFSWIGGAHWQGQKNDNSGYSSPMMCLGSGNGSYTDTELVNKTLRYGACLGDNSTNGSFNPDPRVGAGPASKTTNQVVNFLEYGRCMDVTGENITASFMIVYPCKQDPSPSKTNMKWNHKWVYSEPTGLAGALTNQQIVVKNGGSTGTAGANYCLTTPASGLNPGYPTMTVCSASNQDQKWTRTAQATSYAESWTFTDRHGRCISLGEKMSATEMWSKMTVATCNGGAEQKWNAPPNAQTARLDDLRELN